MKRSLGVIKYIALAVLMVFLFSFTNKRNAQRNITKLDVSFIDENNPFITLETVNKLLIQSQEKVTSINKETLVLNEIEQRLLDNPMIRDAQVFMSIDGVLGAKIEQRTPIARVVGSPDFYLDTDGKKMPLSSVYTTRVPLIMGNSKMDVDKVTELLLKINDDPFMKSSVVGLRAQNNGEIVLELRKDSFKVLFGKVEAIEKKFQNFKAFYKKAKQDNTLQTYGLVNLKFNSQVVATKR
ncbi:cell division protein FtsQ/DivIB [Ulvibacter litoralis]|uniref:Cell division protein FtsQ n=1 Tax=Ulvibacter litoralis TaxID=227084 RepID=A0A1G7GEQ1_9FLAO|nr:cell division protein FtsQ/DivIB [Ulvibacter litoralis]GHC56493.1 cell division protein FtsQ [Ulvibacter litoralis]SDE86604.1 cell division protein FtsQ [Ulvibacter litoralis]